MLDRSKFKQTKTTTLVQADEDLDKKTGKGGFTNDFLTIDNGKNMFRFYPPHPDDTLPEDETNPFAEPKVTSFLKIWQDERDDKGNVVMVNGEPKKVLKGKSIFNSRIHGGTEKDLIDEYIIAANKLANQAHPGTDKVSNDKRKEMLKFIYGFYSKNKDLNIQGFTYTNKWVIYADKIVGGKMVKFGRLEVGKAIKERLNKIANSQEDSESALSVDPFTGVDDGRAVMIEKNPDAATPQDWYSTELDTATVETKIEGKTYKLPREFPLSDEQLEKFDKVKPLKELYQNVFTRKDFNYQLEGLRILDDANNLHLFEDPAFMEIVNEIDSYYPEIEEKQEAGSNESQEQQGESNSGDMFDIMDRAELKAFIATEELGILVKPTTSEEDLRKQIREAITAMENGDGEQTEEVEQTEETQPETTSTVSTGNSAKDRLQAIRDAAKNKA